MSIYVMTNFVRTVVSLLTSGGDINITTNVKLMPFLFLNSQFLVAMFFLIKQIFQNVKILEQFNERKRIKERCLYEKA